MLPYIPAVFFIPGALHNFIFLYPGNPFVMYGYVLFLMASVYICFYVKPFCKISAYNRLGIGMILILAIDIVYHLFDCENLYSLDECIILL